MRLTITLGSLLLLAAAPAAQAQAFPFYLDVDLCDTPAILGSLGTQCSSPVEEWVVEVLPGGAMNTCLRLGASPGYVFDSYAFPQSWSKTGGQVTMDVSSFTSGLYLTGLLAGGGTSGGVVVDNAGLSTPIQSQLFSWDGTKGDSSLWDECVNGTGGGPGLVGSYVVNDGPAYGTYPPVYTCQEACAANFGGNAGDYQCSTDPYTIDNMAWASTWGTACEMVAEDYSFSACGGGYNCGYGGSATSAWIPDWCFMGQTNYCFM